MCNQKVIERLGRRLTKRLAVCRACQVKYRGQERVSHFSLLLEQAFVLVKVEGQPLPGFIDLRIAQFAQRLSPLCMELCKVHTI